MSSRYSVDGVGCVARDAFAMLRAYNPSGYKSLVELASPLHADVVVGDEQFALDFAHGRAMVTLGAPSTAPPFDPVDVVGSRSTLHDVLGGRTRLIDALMRGELSMRGPVDAVARMNDGLAAFVLGMASVPEREMLMNRLGPEGRKSP